jgi:UDP-N-acetylmuramoylalanine--D-glutamate ligase
MMIEVDNMSDAVQMAQRLSEKGDTVLLSPACASFDLFKAMKTEENNLNKRLKIYRKVKFKV